MNIGKAIKTARESAGMTLEQLAEKSRRQVWFIEQLEQNVTTGLVPGDISAIAEALEIPKELLFVMGLEESDVKPGKLDAFKLLFPAMKELTLSIISNKDTDGTTKEN